MARVANHCHYNHLVPGPAAGFACLAMIVDEAVAPSVCSEVLLVEAGEGLVLSVCWVQEPARTGTQDCQVGPGEEWELGLPGVVAQLVVVG